MRRCCRRWRDVRRRYMRGCGGRRRYMRGCGGRRRNMRWCCGRRRWGRGSRRRRNMRWCGGRRRGARRWRCLRGLLGRLLRLALGATLLLLGLGHDQRRGLGVRRTGGQLQRSESCRGKQQESNFCHDGLGPRKGLGEKAWQQRLSMNFGNEPTSVRPDCGLLQTRTCIYFRQRKVRMRRCSLRIQTSISKGSGAFSLAAIRCTRKQSRPRIRYCPCRSQVRACSVPAVHAPAIRRACGPAAPLAVEAHPVPASAEAPRAEGFRAGFPAAVPTAAPA